MEQTHLAGHLVTNLGDVCDITKGGYSLKIRAEQPNEFDFFISGTFTGEPEAN